jgi:hypothetical protein
MKYISLFPLIAICLLFNFSSCDTVDEILELSEEEYIEIIEQCLAEKSGGYVNFTKDVIVVYLSTSDSCNLSGDSTIVSSDSTATTNYSYSSQYSYTLNCTGAAASSMSVTLNSTGDFENTEISSSDIGTGNSSIGNLPSAQTNYEFSGIYDRNGIITSKSALNSKFTYNMTFDMSNVLVNKSTELISSGTATYSLAGVSQSVASQSFNYTGNVTFNGSNSATIDFQGTNYTLTID